MKTYSIDSQEPVNLNEIIENNSLHFTDIKALMNMKVNETIHIEIVPIKRVK